MRSDLRQCWQGACPLRQLILAGQGSSDSAVTVLGMFVGAALCHNFGLASSGTSLNPETKELVAGAVTTNGKIALCDLHRRLFCDRIYE